ncbi:DUF4160 domain-containing protein [Geomonas subterranea]|uniref:DUF4160 domain-containing protein n=1 Tax=Geomonas subterranea TaxID=2847989 RepID=UPI001CD781C0|nr:DUF4160 domain-containing protein [Geomonas fuzhouensis]
MRKLFRGDLAKFHKMGYLPHFHAEYQGDVAVFAIEDDSILDGSLYPAKRKLVEAWMEIHKDIPVTPAIESN